MKRLATLMMGLLMAGGAGALSAPAPFAPSLVTKMRDARDGSPAPIKRMWYAPDEPVRDADWPFAIARVERLLEGALVLGEDGVYRLKRETSERDARTASAQALAYVNQVIAEWAVMQLDVKFTRCDAATIKALAGFQMENDPNFWQNYAIFTKTGVEGGGSMKAGGWVTAWQITPALFLVLTNELGKECHPRDYRFVMWDGKKDWPIAGFDSFPDAGRVALVKRILTSATAVNNLAVALHLRAADRTHYVRDYVESLLRRAARDGCETAFHNLGVLMEEKGLPDEAKAFYSRERSNMPEKKGD